MANSLFVEVIFPLALPKLYTYEVPSSLHDDIEVGRRVEVSLRNKLYSALVYAIHPKIELEYTPKPIISILDEKPIVNPSQFKFWRWIADYYCCTLGEVMNAAVPSGFKLESATKIVIHEDFEDDFSELTDEEYLVAEAIELRQELSIQEVTEILNKKTIYPVIRSLLEKRILDIKEELIQKFKPREIKVIYLADYYKEDKDRVTEALDLCTRSKKQTDLILAYLTLSKLEEEVPVSELYSMANANSTVVNAVVKKGIFEVKSKVVSRIKIYDDDVADTQDLTPGQTEALTAIRQGFEDGKPVLLHGVTGSGKTRCYIELMQEAIKEGKQVLYLLPEIALTTQITQRLQSIFGDELLVYHSKMSNEHRVEAWNAIKAGHKLVLGARSGLFLPFNNLGLIVVDEEHDSSYKQSSPAPRYNARDCSLVLAQLLKAQVILGSATPSIESYQNAVQEKFHLVNMLERFGDSVLPEIKVIDLKYEKKTGRLKSLLSHPLKEAIEKMLEARKQVILFVNRRGFSPAIQCNVCGWTAECVNCDVTMTLHRYFNELKCHYCGYHSKNPVECADCGSDDLYEMGFGTEQAEVVVQEIFPKVRIERMDNDTVRTKSSLEKLVYEFANREIDILIGTQMVTKGFDFDHIGLVGILNADSMIRFPDFRAHERAFQLMTQVAGRAGRRGERGEVHIQVYDTTHPIIDETVNNNYNKFFNRELSERKEWAYPPYFRMINIELKHKNPKKVALAATHMANRLKERLGLRVIGPAVPGIARIRNQFIQYINVKIERDPKVINFTKKFIKFTKAQVLNEDGIKSVRITIDVDPY